MARATREQLHLQYDRAFRSELVVWLVSLDLWMTATSSSSATATAANITDNFAPEVWQIATPPDTGATVAPIAITDMVGFDMVVAASTAARC